MDFVQRNLINERNDLQVELAKAKLLIAELSEAYRSLPQESIQQPRDKATWKAIGNRTSERKGVVSNKKENLVSDNVQGLSDPANADLKDSWDEYILQMKLWDNGFGDFYTRYLENDNYEVIN